VKHIFFDESGDISGDSRYFFVTFAITNDAKEPKRLVKKVLESLAPKNRARVCGYLHAYKEDEYTRRKFFTKFTERDFEVYCKVVDKSKLSPSEKILNPHYLYTYFIAELLNELPIGYLRNTEFVASKKETNKRLNEKFKKFICAKTGVKPSIEPAYTN